MIVSDVKTRVKRQFGDESAIQITDADIVIWINDAQNEIAMANEGILEATITMDLIAEQDAYTIPADLLMLRSIRVRSSSTEPYVNVRFKSLAQFDLDVDTWEQNTIRSNIPVMYTTHANQIILFPKPDTTFGGGLKLLYVKKPAAVANDADTLSVPFMYHTTVVKYCLQQAYELDEDWEGSSNKLAQFKDDLNLNSERETRGATVSYPIITVMPDDSW